MGEVHHIEQRSDAWFAARVGKATASRIADIVARTKSGPSASRDNYLAELVVERLTGSQTPMFVNAAMQWGIDMEDEARGAYAFLTGVTVEEVGFVDHSEVSAAGASPDGLVGDDGLVEIKCPQKATHLATLRSETIPAKYETQMLWQMACTGRAWCDFVSYHPEFPDHLRLFVKRLPRDDARIAELEAEVRKFMADVQRAIDDLNARFFAESEEPNLLRAG